MIGIFSDSYGDLGAFEAAYELLRGRGAKRFFFTGGRYGDLDDWVTMRGEKARGGRAYSDTDFLTDVSAFLGQQQQAARPAAFGAPGASEHDDAATLLGRFLRVPEKDSLQYLDPGVDNKAVDMLGDNLCCIVHDKNDLSREDLLNAVYFIHGKDAEPKVVQIGPRFFITPGKLTGAAEQTCGLLGFEEKVLRFSAFTLDGRTLIDRQSLSGERRTKLSVK